MNFFKVFRGFQEELQLIYSCDRGVSTDLISLHHCDGMFRVQVPGFWLLMSFSNENMS